MMVQIAPFITLSTGVWMLVIVSMVKTYGVLNGILFRVIPSTLGAATIFASAVLLMGRF